MDKPLYLLPFIYVYKLVFFVLKLPIMFIRYFSLGAFFVLWFLSQIIVMIIKTVFKYIYISVIVLSKTVYRIVKYLFKGFTVLSFIVYKFIIYLFKGFTVLSFIIYKFIKYLIFGVIFPLVIVYNGVFAVVDKIRNMTQVSRDRSRNRKEAIIRKKEALIEEKRRKAEFEIIEKQKIAEQKQKLREQKLIKKQEEVAFIKKRKQEEIALRKKRKQKDEFVNEKVTIEKKGLSGNLNSIFKAIGNIPKSIVDFFKRKYNNSSFAKSRRNKRDINRQTLLINFEGDDAKRSEVKIVYQYLAKNPEGKLVKGFFEAYSKVEVHSFLLSEGFEVYSIKTSQWIQMTHANVGKSGGKIKNSDLIFFLTQLSTYIKAGITLVESLKILSRQFKNKNYQRIFRTIIYDLSMGDNFSDALAKQGNAFPRLLINMVKAAEMTGELPEALDDMSEYYTETEKTRKQMVTAMMYPLIILVIAVSVMTFIMIYVVPQFVGIYENMDNAKVPAFTMGVMAFSAFMKKNIAWLLIGLIIVIVIFIYLFKNVKVFRSAVQWVLMHIPVIGNVIIYNEVTMFTKTFASLLRHNVFITDSMEILNKITGNEIYKMLILDTITNLARGEKISLAFKDQWAFPIPAYEMIVTGEKTGQLAEMMAKVSDYYQELHKNSVTRIKTFVEPILIILLTAGVGVIVLAIVIPMFDVYQNISAQ